MDRMEARALLVTGAAILSLPADALAQGAPIIVTGERKASTKAQTASSVVVFSETDIEESSGADRLDQLLALVPNVQAGSGGEGPTIRGQDTTGPLRDLPAFLGGTRPRTSLQVDGRSVGYNEFAFGAAPLWDVQRVEVFRSPQTTTQGRNSIAGAIFIETADPTWNWEGKARALADTGDAWQVSGAVGGPLVDSALAVRLSGDLRRGESSSRLTSPARDIDPNRDDYEQLRLKVLATPDALPGFRLLATLATNSSQSPQIEGIRAPFEHRRDDTANYGIFKTRTDSLTLRAEQALSPEMRLHAVASMGDTGSRRFAQSGFGETLILGTDRSLEIVLTRSAATGVDFVVGVHGAEADLDQDIDLSATPLGLGKFDDEQASRAIFSEATLRLLPRLELTAGARWQHDRQSRVGTLGSAMRPTTLDYHRSFEAFLPKASLAYAFDETSRVGLLVQRAYNPGGVTLNLSTFEADAFDAEYLWDIEAFARTALFDGKLGLSANVFHYWMRNLQRTLLRELQTPAGTIGFVETANAPAGWSRGAELELDWRPSRQLRVGAQAAVLDTRLTGALSDADPLLGKEFQRSPHLSAALAVSWKPVEQLSLDGQLRYHSSYFSDDTNDPARRIGAAAIADVRAEWRQGPLALFGYARNVFDSFHLTYLFANPLATAEPPRELGAGISLNF